MFVCGCGRWMHTDGVEERVDQDGADQWLVRTACLGCGFRLGGEAPPDQAAALVDRLIWTDDARHVLDRMPHYAAPLCKTEVEGYARSKDQRVVSRELLARARNRVAVTWDPEAEQRLHNVPASIRGLAKVELERTAAEKGLACVTVSLMEEVKARYFGLAEKH